jgi:hypothetical protein
VIGKRVPSCSFKINTKVRIRIFGIIENIKGILSICADRFKI